MDERQYTHIDLFSGIGGFALSARWTGFKTIVFCERDEWCQKVLAKNFGAEVVSDANGSGLQESRSKQQASWIGQLPEVMADPTSRESRQSPKHEGREDIGRGSEKIPIIPDIHDFDGSKWRGATLLTGGFPCQPFSCAGKRGGTTDDRFLWPEMVRVIAEARPTWIIGENVRGLVTMELDRVLSDLEGINYSCWPVIIPACAVDAKHRRDRIWILATDSRRNDGTKSERQYERAEVGCGSGKDGLDAGEDVANDDGKRSEKQFGQNQLETLLGKGPLGRCNESGNWCQWPVEPDVGRVAHGISRRVDRLKGLGNAIVPQVAAELMRMIMSIEPSLFAGG